MDKYGRKFTAIPGLSMFAMALVAISFVSNFEGLVAVAALFGLGDGITTGLMMTIVADLAPKECKSEFIAGFKLFSGSPAIITPMIIGVLCTQHSLFFAAMLSAGIGFVTMLWMAFGLEESSKQSVEYKENEKSSVETELMDESDGEIDI